MRVVGGRHRGLRLVAPNGEGTRPTSDRLRETIFNMLLSRAGDLHGVRVLDLFAGTGAMGIEAISRGAGFALFVEVAVEARAAIRRNVEAVGATGITRIWRRDATELGDCPVAPFDLVFADPPYGRGLGERALRAAHGGSWLAANALVVLEERADAMPETIAGLTPAGSRVLRDSAVGFFTVADPAP